MTHLFLALIVGFGVGIVVGALGAGGGILSVPVLVYLLGQEPHAASAGSLVIVGLTAVVSLMPRAREGHVRWRDGLVFGVVSSVGNVLGSRASLMVDAHMLMILFSVLLMAVGVFMVRKSCRMSQVGDAGTVAHADSGSTNPHRSVWLLVACATATGALTGFFGVGGGFAVVPMLVLALAIPGAFGGGDIKLMSVSGLLIGGASMICAMCIGIITGGAYVTLMLVRKRLNKTDQFAFGPFLAFGLATAIFLGDKMAVWYLQFGAV